VFNSGAFRRILRFTGGGINLFDAPYQPSTIPNIDVLCRKLSKEIESS